MEKFAVAEVSGLYLIHEAINKEQEAWLLKKTELQDWNKELARWTQHYGFKYDYKSRDLGQPIASPKHIRLVKQHIERLLDKIDKKEILDNRRFVQTIVNRYEPGQGISPHTDSDVFGDVICSLSTESSCVMKFIKADKSVEMFLPRRSLLVLTGEARSKWKHEIEKLKVDSMLEIKDDFPQRINYPRTTRISYTFRQLKA
jgi:alkylated DNA repair dioxygenase AlkB